MSEEFLGLIEDFGEVALDSRLPEGVLKDLPIVGIGFSLIKICKDIRDTIFVTKLKSFIDAVDKNSKWQERFSDPEECLEISKDLLYIIDHCDSDEKLKLIGLAFNHLVTSDISRDDYFYIAAMIKNSYYPFLKVLLQIESCEERITNDGQKYDYNAISHLLNIGALNYDGQTAATFDLQNQRGSRPAVIVVMNGYGDFLKSLLAV